MQQSTKGSTSANTRPASTTWLLSLASTSLSSSCAASGSCSCTTRDGRNYACVRGTNSFKHHFAIVLTILRHMINVSMSLNMCKSSHECLVTSRCPFVTDARACDCLCVYKMRNGAELLETQIALFHIYMSRKYALCNNKTSC